MVVATLTSKGQITLPKEVRDDLGVEAGSKIAFIRTSRDTYAIRVTGKPLMRLSGSLKYDGPPIDADEYERRFAKALAEKFAP
ncbi:AbrB/MazE/SpoVT family DNA-binding domain-containing protein [Nocardioides speluncae]|uniref:AbrB/MazE/SpoVT family DNA-binding domain-containing protein n=1 Tax=Nocardioides speluncae TaxID=2670337 RepID=UPI000D6909E0|nr:AbrB/MazE/SpoVT family DNA-binding domain-containing protein [Nocardioides speluncae]